MKSKRLFEVTLILNAEQMAEAMISYGDHVNGVTPYSNGADVPELPPQKPKKMPNRIKFSATTPMIRTGKAPHNLSKSDSLALQVATKMLAGRAKGLMRIELVKAVEETFKQSAMNPGGASSCISKLAKKGYFDKVE